MNMKDGVGQNPTKDLVVHKGSDVSIGTQPEGESVGEHSNFKKVPTHT